MPENQMPTPNPSFEPTSLDASCFDGRQLKHIRCASLTITAEVPMIPTERVPTHPGEVLQEEFLVPLGLTQVKLADHIGVPVQRINEIIRGKRGVTRSDSLVVRPSIWDDSAVVGQSSGEL